MIDAATLIQVMGWSFTLGGLAVWLLYKKVIKAINDHLSVINVHLAAHEEMIKNHYHSNIEE